MFPKQCIRLRVPPERANSLHQHPLLGMAQGQGGIKKRVLRFYDTPQWSLRQAGLELLVHNKGAGWRQRLLRVTARGRLGLEKWRGETLVRHDLAGERLELLRMLRDPAAAASFATLDAGTLGHRLTVRVQQRQLRLSRGAGRSVTLLEEAGEIVDAGGTTPFHDLVIMADDDASELGYEIALSLLHTLQGGLLFVAAEERSMAQAWPQPVTDEPAWPRLPSMPAVDMAEAYYLLNHALLHALYDELPQILHGRSDKPYARQRNGVALLEALALLNQWLPPLAHAQGVELWQKLVEQLQDREGWGLFLEALLEPYAENLDESFTTAPWLHRSQRYGQQGQQQLAQLCHGVAFAQALLGLGLWLARRGWLRRQDEQQPMEPLNHWLRQRLEENSGPMLAALRAGKADGLRRSWQQWLLLKLFGALFEQISVSSSHEVALDLSLMEYGIYQEALERVLQSGRFVQQVAPLAERFKQVAVEADGATRADFEAWWQRVLRQQQGLFAQSMAELELSAGFWVEHWGEGV
ncbi:hypothetical protein Mmc1_0997 [Magnetococcus marinus MC-1]|uniref:Uncharacterized protein n=1 Tax=Magnetococcus marinus (strain ATCC BAA-1437 / JCM 17883 / MC-1) TaxID=156889 RepID=A0L6C2_MAGMM|nr:hypothetical protein [Magnetococcus marinus]ABK43515.1 hypothetical protein Mmc1_0997 [Magnetococcus marinus MC-1]